MHPIHIDTASRAIRVAIVDGDADWLDTLSKAVRAAAGMRLVEIAGSRAEGMALLDATPADVLLIDPELPDGSGIRVIHAAARRWTRCHIMVHTCQADEAQVMRSIEAGATGYLLKDDAAAGIAGQIRALAGGGSPISPVIARQLLSHFRHGGSRSDVPPSSSVLSARETEVLGFITKGFTVQEIAKLLQLSHFTVRSFVRRIYGKLKVSSKAEAIYEARTQGLVAD